MKLSTQKIQQHFTSAFLAQKNTLATFHLFESIASTNTWLKEKGQCGDVCIAEQQTAGRGRRGNQWFSPKADNIYVSLNWCFKRIPAHISLLSLVVGMSIAQALQTIGLADHGVKWPNDLYWKGQKMGGILIESVTSSALSSSTLRVVIGIGLNINMPQTIADKIDQPWVSLHTILGKKIDRHQLLALLLEQLVHDLQRVEQLNLAQFQTQWQQWDVLQGQSVNIMREDETLVGTVQGLDDHGRIGIKVASGQLRYFSSAEIRLKK